MFGENRPTRDRSSLPREVDALIKISDIRATHRAKDRVAFQWWEPLLVSCLFISGLGFIITIFKLIPATNPILFWFVFGWFALFVLTLIACVEFLLAKVAALRKLQEIQARELEALKREIAGQANRE